MRPECSQVLDRLGQPLPAELAAHVAQCAECQALVEGFGALAPVRAAVEPARLEAVQARARAELEARPRVLPWWQEVVALLGVYGVALGLGAWLLESRAGGLLTSTAPMGVVVALGLLLLLAIVGGAVAALAPLRQPAWALVGTSAAVVALAVVLGGSGLAMQGVLVGVVGCTKSLVVLSALPLVAALVLLRRSAYHPARALAAGLSAGAVGLMLLHLHCPDGSASHLLLAHVAPWLLLGGAVLAVRRWLGSQTYAP